MKVFNKIVELQNELFQARKEGKEIGLVPTMGALHEGHASLVKRSVKVTWIAILVPLMPTASSWRLVALTMCLLHP